MTFWTLTTSDLYVPTSSYERQVAQIKSQLNAVEDNRDMVTLVFDEKKANVLLRANLHKSSVYGSGFLASYTLKTALFYTKFLSLILCSPKARERKRGRDVRI